jgi:glycopeptide antibiotics resistance protein
VFAPDTDPKATQRLRLAGHIMVGFIILGSLLPLHWSHLGFNRWPLLFNWRDMQPYDVFQNIAALVPVGIVYGASRDAAGRWRSISIASVIMVVLQLAQLWLPDRSPRLTDAVANGAGLVAGLVLARATHMMRKIPGAPQPVELAILLVLLCHVAIIAMINEGMTSVMDQWLLQMGNFVGDWALPGAKMLVAGFVVRALVNTHTQVIWIFITLCAACLAMSHTAMTVRLALALLAGALAAQCLPRRWAVLIAVAALITIILWEGLTPWIPLHRDMTWIPMKSLLTRTSMVSYVTLSWKIFCWSSLALFLSEIFKQGRSIIAFIVALVGTIEIAQMHIASGFPDVTDIMLAAVVAALVVLAVQQAGLQLGRSR